LYTSPIPSTTSGRSVNRSYNPMKSQYVED
jgi:hypothetical protein